MADLVFEDFSGVDQAVETMQSGGSFSDWVFSGGNGSDTGGFAGTPSGSSWTLGNFIDTGLSGVNYGLAVYDRITAANDKRRNSQLNDYLSRGSYDIAKTQIAGQVDVAKTNADVSRLLAQTRANLAGSAASAAQLGQSPNSLMLYLTILGLVFAGLQLYRTK